MNEHQDAALRVGWASRNITPEQLVLLGGQFKMRVSSENGDMIFYS